MERALLLAKPEKNWMNALFQIKTIDILEAKERDDTPVKSELHSDHSWLVLLHFLSHQVTSPLAAGRVGG